MFFIRLLFWVVVVAIFLPADLRQEIFSLDQTATEQARRSDPTYTSSSFDPAGADRLVPYIVENATTFCERQRFACQLGEAALMWAHEQAVSASGQLHYWLEQSLQARKETAAHAV